MEAVPPHLVEAEADKYWERWVAGPADEAGGKALACAVGFYKEAWKGFEQAEQHEQTVAVLEKLVPALVAFESRYAAVKAAEAIADCLLRKLLVSDVDRFVQLFRSCSALYVQEEAENLLIAKLRQTAEHFAAQGDRLGAARLLALVRELLPGDLRETSRPEAVVTLVALLAEEQDYRGALQVLEEESRLAVNHPRALRFAVDKLLLAVALEDVHGAERIFDEATLE